MLTRWILRKCEPVCVRVCAWRCCLYVRVCACICKNHMYTFPLVAALSVRRCVRVYNVYVFVLNVFLYKIGSSGSSTSRRTTLALRMKPDLQKYVARVFRVFGTFSPLSCPQFSLFLGLVRSISLIPLTPIRSVILLFPFHTLPITRPCTGFSLFFFRQNSYAPFRSRSPPPPSHFWTSPRPTLVSRSKEFQYRSLNIRFIHNSERERSTPSSWIFVSATRCLLLFPGRVL